MLHPDGIHVLFRSAPDIGDTPFDVWIRRVDGTDQPRRINSRQQERGKVTTFELTPDGDHIAYLGDLETYNRRDAYVAPVFGSGDQFRLHPVPPEDGRIKGFDLAGDHVLVLGDFRTLHHDEIFSTPVDGSGPTRVISELEGGQGSIRSMVTTPDGSQVVYVGSTTSAGGLQAYVSPVATSDQRLVATLGADANFDQDFLVSPDGQRVVLMTFPLPDERHDLWSARLDGQGDLVRLTDADSLAGIHAVMGDDIRISPDSRRVVWAKDLAVNRQRGGLFSAPIDRSGGQVLLSGGDQFVDPVYFEIAPDGTRVAYFGSDDSEDPDRPHQTPLFSAPIDAAGARVMVSEMMFTDETGGAIAFEFSPDSATLFFSGNLDGERTERSYASSHGQQPPRRVSQLGVTTNDAATAQVTWGDPFLASRATGFDLTVDPSVTITRGSRAAGRHVADLTDLDADTTYTVTVRARNEAGPGQTASVLFAPGQGTVGAPVPPGDPVRPGGHVGVVRRLAGQDRYATAAAIALDAHPEPVAEVVLASGEDFPDALAAVPLADRLDAPLLLTAAAELPGPTVEALRRLAPQRVTLVGGPLAVDEAVVDALREVTGADVRRLAGQDRFATAVAVAAEVEEATTFLVATGRDFPDALAGGAVSDGAPLVLVERDRVPGATSAFLAGRTVERLVVLGGEAAVGPATADALAQISTPDRIAGADRYATAAELATSRVTARSAYLAIGTGFADALAGGPSASRDGAPLLLLAGDGSVPDVTAAFLADMPNLDRVVVLGGSAVVPDTTISTIEELIRRS